VFSNKGIGFEVVRSLFKQLPPDWTVYLTSRSEELGHEAIQKLKSEETEATANLTYYQLDITKGDSVERFRDYLRQTHGGLDILVNNAGFAYKGAAVEPFWEQAQNTIEINFFGTVRVSNALIPLLREGGRVVNVGSMAGSISLVQDKKLRDELMRDNLTLEELTGHIRSFVQETKEGTHQKEGWPNTAYGTSKIAVHCLTRIQARDPLLPRGAVVNVCCPGWCKTDMAGFERPPRTAAQGADTIVYLAFLPSGSPVNGKFYADRTERPW